MFVKICGLSTAETVAAAVAAGADAVGFVLTASPRRITAAQARALAAQVPDGVLTVAVFAAEPMDQVLREAREAGVRAVQLHGNHPPRAFADLRRADPDGTLTLVRATSAACARPAGAGSHGEDLLIVDAPRPGSGRAWDWHALGTAPAGTRWMLAGGLAPHNVAEAVAAVRPWGVDVSSGVESARGVKDTALIADFVARARSAAAV